VANQKQVTELLQWRKDIGHGRNLFGIGSGKAMYFCPPKLPAGMVALHITLLVFAVGDRAIHLPSMFLARAPSQAIEFSSFPVMVQIVVAEWARTPYIYLNTCSEINEDSHLTHASTWC